MKLSFMTFACPDWDFAQVVDAAVRHGYHGIEFRCDAGHRHGVEVSASREARAAFREVMQGAGIEPCCLATSLQFATSKALDDVPARVQLAADIGCKALRVFAGPPAEGMGMADVIRTVGEQLRAAAELAHGSQVEFWLETHDTFCKAADCAAAVRRADHPAVGINYDNMHPYRMGESLELTFAALGTLIRHAHLHDAVSKADTVMIRPLGQGDLPMDAMFEGLVKSGFDGYLSGEWFHHMYGEDPDTALAWYKRDMTALAERHSVTLAR